MISFKSVLLLIGIFSIFLFICLFGSLPQLQDTWLSRTRQWLIDNPRRVFHALDPSGRLESSIVHTWNTNYTKLAVIVPIGYIVVVSTSLYYFYTECYHRLLITRIHEIFIPIVSFLPYLATVLAVFSDPGQITKENHCKVLKKFQFDSILFMPDTTCRTCKFEKPARSKHCSTCGHCFAMADHHCIWINNCVGYRNYRWFFFYVSSNVLLLGYGLYLNGGIIHRSLKELMKNGDIKPSDFLNIMGWISTITYSDENRTAGCLMLLCGMLILVAGGFLCIHIRYIYLGTTTNETSKWDMINECIEDESLYFYGNGNTKEHFDEPTITLQKLSDGSFNRTLTDEEQHRISSRGLTLQKVKGFQDINNIYDKGFYSNSKEIFFPDKL